MTKSRTPFRETSSDIMAMVLAALMRGRKTRIQLRESISVGKVAIDRAVRSLRNHGVAYVAERRQNGSRGKPVEVIALNASPFENEDAAPYEGRRRRAEANRRSAVAEELQELCE